MIAAVGSYLPQHHYFPSIIFSDRAPPRDSARNVAPAGQSRGEGYRRPTISLCNEGCTDTARPISNPGSGRLRTTNSPIPRGDGELLRDSYVNQPLLSCLAGPIILVLYFLHLLQCLRAHTSWQSPGGICPDMSLSSYLAHTP